MHYRISFIFITFICLFSFATTGIAQNANTDEDSKPVILYSGTPKKYEIADIKVEGVKNYEDYVLIGLSGLSVGQTICKRFTLHTKGRCTFLKEEQSQAYWFSSIRI